jgi:IstB-like ATP binding protein
MVERRIKAAKFPTVKSLDSFDFAAIPSLNKALVMELARCAYIERHENVIALGNSGSGKSHIALGLGLAACQKGLSVGFTAAAAIVHELMEARDEKRLLRLQRQLCSPRSSGRTRRSRRASGRRTMAWSGSGKATRRRAGLRLGVWLTACRRAGTSGCAATTTWWSLAVSARRR